MDQDVPSNNRRTTTSNTTTNNTNDDEGGENQLPPYELRNTGQGLQRVKQSPRVYRAMHEILARTKHQLGK